MTPAALPQHHIFQKRSDIVQQRVLPFIDKHRCGSVQRLQVHDAVANPALVDDFINPVSHIDELQPIVGNPVYDSVENLESPLRGRLRCVFRYDFQVGILECDEIKIDRLQDSRLENELAPVNRQADLKIYAESALAL